MRSGAEGGRCPHCKAPVPKEHGRSCLECGGSLQKRYLAIGCLSSKPLLLLAVGVPLWLARDGSGAHADPRPNSAPTSPTGDARAEPDTALGTDRSASTPGAAAPVR